MSLDDIPKKVQYVLIDSNFVNGTNNLFSLDLTLESNTHVEDMSRVLGIKVVDFYITQVGETNPTSDSHPSNIAKFVDIMCPDVPKVAQILDERNGQILARVALERHYSHSSHTVLRDKQARLFQRKQNYFNPISKKRSRRPILWPPRYPVQKIPNILCFCISYLRITLRDGSITTR